MIKQKADDYAQTFAVVHGLEAQGNDEQLVAARYSMAKAEDALDAEIKKAHSYLIFATWAAIIGWGAWGYLMFKG